MDKQSKRNRKEVVLVTKNAQGLIIPRAHQLADGAELLATALGQVDMESHRKKNQKKRKKQMTRETRKIGKKNLKNKFTVNTRFIIKVQWMHTEPDRMIIYNKSRKYCVCVNRRGQTKMFTQLMKTIKREGLGAQPQLGAGRKAYFDAWVDSKQRLHVLTGNVLALQPW